MPGNLPYFALIRYREPEVIIRAAGNSGRIPSLWNTKFSNRTVGSDIANRFPIILHKPHISVGTKNNIIRAGRLLQGEFVNLIGWYRNYADLLPCNLSKPDRVAKPSA